MAKLHRGRVRAALAASVVLAAVVGAAVAGIVAHASAQAARVTITEREFHLTLSKRTLAPGAVTLVIVNRGQLSHSLAIKGPGISRRIPGTIAPGKQRKLTLKLKSGKYSLWCPVAGHAAKGMKATIKVTGSTNQTTSTGGGSTGWG